jgi:transcriptional regulator with XRE-family HTH domain
MPDAAEVLADRLRDIRGKRSMAQMAEKVGVSRQTWWKYENRKAFPAGDKLDLIAAVFDVTVAELFESEAA